MTMSFPFVLCLVSTALPSESSDRRSSAENSSSSPSRHPSPPPSCDAAAADGSVPASPSSALMGVAP